MKRILYIWFPRFATDRAARFRPDTRVRPTVITSRDHNRLTIMATNHAGELAGARPGQGLADIRTLCPDILTIPANPAADQNALRKLALWCTKFTPWVTPDISYSFFEGGLFLDITGCAHIFSSESNFINMIKGYFEKLDLQNNIAISDTAGSAWAWARYGNRDQPIIPPGKQADFLSDLLLPALRLPASTVETLARLGLTRIKDLEGLPRAALANRFDRMVRNRLDQALGVVEEPISPLRPLARYETRQEFIEPLNTAESLPICLSQLSEQLCNHLEQSGLGARRLDFTIFRIDGSAEAVSIGVSRPSHASEHLCRLFAPRLEALDPDPGVEVALLSAPVTEPFENDQEEMSRTAQEIADQGTMSLKNPNALSQTEISALVDRLSNRLGPDAVFWTKPVETPLPETQQSQHSALDCMPLTQNGNSGWNNWPTGVFRPVRLFAKPEPVQVILNPENGKPQALVWRKRSARLTSAEGPERRHGRWWQNETETRDYWIAGQDTGHRLWLFQDLMTTRWHVQGLFG